MVIYLCICICYEIKMIDDQKNFDLLRGPKSNSETFASVALSAMKRITNSKIIFLCL